MGSTINVDLSGALIRPCSGLSIRPVEVEHLQFHQIGNTDLIYGKPKAQEGSLADRSDGFPEGFLVDRDNPQDIRLLGSMGERDRWAVFRTGQHLLSRSCERVHISEPSADVLSVGSTRSSMQDVSLQALTEEAAAAVADRLLTSTGSVYPVGSLMLDALGPNDFKCLRFTRRGHDMVVLYKTKEHLGRITNVNIIDMFVLEDAVWTRKESGVSLKRDGSGFYLYIGYDGSHPSIHADVLFDFADETLHEVEFESEFFGKYFCRAQLPVIALNTEQLLAEDLPGIVDQLPRIN